MEAESISIPNRLKLHRKLSGLTQIQAARLLGFQTVTQLSQWESGADMPSGTNLIKLGIIYNTYPNELYFEYYQSLKKALKAKEDLSGEIL
ncbi:helix-turn-helix domain-containing protein [Mucilaginibacter sp. OK098]|uniref:helix-turn-helix domain-containing protein n=1 Tax=Mucilaginibacter sp. OK098 TaxID=1855297 RepID=UPI00091A3AD9|nr:helix-turn-helix transcriptional regulator [Mucilaginibacter sp. OK098]SHN26022.1 Helix-turn-helix [Mucilaginibacter sp. OK098]